ncbi:MAG: aspartate 1-decarboxylase [Lentisphaeria bacterium]|nr:aspartate 1-decarboxylase [Lentisphaeria bacterium]MBQ8756516.1 aspartate 1-decarboxylase [Lentisphaeria bacterium]MBQ9776429.1 aspartate 1-decarboxylase [Lentisphaeria bacterium]
MQRIMLSGKIHTARLTACDMDYEGSLEIDSELLEEAGILPYEKILVVNRTCGSRLETYAIPGKAGSRRFCLNGPAVHLGSVGDVVTIMAFGVFSEEEAKTLSPRVIVLDEKNEIIMQKGGVRR